MTAGTMRRRVLVIHNPTAGRRRPQVLAAVVRALEGQGATCRLRPTTRAGDAVAFAAGAERAEWDVVVAAGGDGTINEVANGLLMAADPPPLAVIPLGTANVLAIELGLPAGPEALAQVIATGAETALHPGMAGGRGFLLMAGAGFDACVVHGVGRRLKRLLGKGAYVVQTLVEALRWRWPPLRIVADGREYTAHMAVACKGRYYGGPHVAAPGARLDGDSLELLLFHGRGLRAQMRYALALLRGTVARQSDVTVVTARQVSITAAVPVPVQIDGDDGGSLPLTLAMAPRPLTVLAPSAGAGAAAPSAAAGARAA